MGARSTSTPPAGGCVAAAAPRPLVLARLLLSARPVPLLLPLADGGLAVGATIAVRPLLKADPFEPLLLLPFLLLLLPFLLAAAPLLLLPLPLPLAGPTDPGGPRGLITTAGLLLLVLPPLDLVEASAGHMRGCWQGGVGREPLDLGQPGWRSRPHTLTGGGPRQHRHRAATAPGRAPDARRTGWSAGPATAGRPPWVPTVHQSQWGDRAAPLHFAPCSCREAAMAYGNRALLPRPQHQLPTSPVVLCGGLMAALRARTLFEEAPWGPNGEWTAVVRLQ